MSDYIRNLELELVRAARARQRTPYLRRGLAGISLGGVLTGAGGIAALGVAVLALVLVGHSHPSGRAGRSAHSPAGAAALVAQLAVLRRPQTAADRTEPTALLRSLNVSAGHGERIALNLTRLLATLPGSGAGSADLRERVFLVIDVPDRSDPGAHAFASVATVGIRRAAGSPTGVPTSVFYTRMSAFPASGGGYNTAVVPDGVTRVRWDFDGQFGGAEHPRRTTVYAVVRHNLAFVPSSRYEGRVTRVTWYGAHHQILRTVTGPSTLSTLVWKPPATHTAIIAPTSKNAKLLAQINLQPPSTRRSRAAGVLAVYRRPGVLTLSVTAAGLAPNAKHNLYAVWITSSSRHRLLGFVNPPVRGDGRLTAAGVFPPNARTFSRVLITLETSQRPAAPGKILLEGRLRFG